MTLPDRSPLRAVPGTLVVAVLTVLGGAWSLAGTAAAYVPALLVPSAIGLPLALPAVRISPLGGSTVGFWLVDLLAALVLLTIVALRLSRPVVRPSRAFRTGVGAVVLGLLAANLLRAVHLSLVTPAGLGSYVAVVLGSALVALLWGLLIGVLVGLVNVLVHVVATGGVGTRRAPVQVRSADAGVPANDPGRTGSLG